MNHDTTTSTVPEELCNLDLTIHFQKATGVRDEDWVTQSDPYFLATLDKKVSYTYVSPLTIPCCFHTDGRIGQIQSHPKQLESGVERSVERQERPCKRPTQRPGLGQRPSF